MLLARAEISPGDARRMLAASREQSSAVTTRDGELKSDDGAEPAVRCGREPAPLSPGRLTQMGLAIDVASRHFGRVVTSHFRCRETVQSAAAGATAEGT